MVSACKMIVNLIGLKWTCGLVYRIHVAENSVECDKENDEDMVGDFVEAGFQLSRMKLGINDRWRGEKRKRDDSESMWVVCYSIIIWVTKVN